MEFGLSIVIPALNEERRLPSTLDALLTDLPVLLSTPWEILVVDDGSTDRTGCVVESESSRGPVCLLVATCNEGKGAASMRGIRSASYSMVMILDADLPIPTPTIAILWDRARDADLVLGSRRIPGASFDRPQPLARRIGGRALRAGIRSLGYVGSSDPQCGVKMLRTDRMKTVLDEVECKGFGFDVELIERSLRAGLDVVEWPLAWSHVDGSSLHPARDAFATLRELALLRGRLKRNGRSTTGTMR